MKDPFANLKHNGWIWNLPQPLWNLLRINITVLTKYMLYNIRKFKKNNPDTMCETVYKKRFWSWYLTLIWLLLCLCKKDMFVNLLFIFHISKVIQLCVAHRIKTKYKVMNRNTKEKWIFRSNQHSITNLYNSSCKEATSHPNSYPGETHNNLQYIV